MQRLEISAARQIVLLNLALWTVAFAMFMGPASMTGRADVHMLVYTCGTMLAGVVFCGGLYLVIHRTAGMRKWPRMAAVGAATLLIFATHAVLDTLWMAAVYTSVYQETGKQMNPTLVTAMNLLYLAPVYLIYVGGVALTFVSHALRDHERSLAAAREMAQAAQLAALRFQVNPHFLFNTLNAVTTLISSGRNAEAEAVVMRLSEFFRASLVAEPDAQVSLSEEFDLVGSYLDIESARFGPRLMFDIDCPEALRTALVPHFLLQPLVENAVKHGVAQTKRPVTITLRAFMRNEALVLRVVDNGDPGASELPPGAGVGLNNVAGRLEAMFGGAGRLTTISDDSGFIAQIEMPFSTDETWKAAA